MKIFHSFDRRGIKTRILFSVDILSLFVSLVGYHVVSAQFNGPISKESHRRARLLELLNKTNDNIVSGNLEQTVQFNEPKKINRYSLRFIKILCCSLYLCVVMLCIGIILLWSLSTICSFALSVSLHLFLSLILDQFEKWTENWMRKQIALCYVVRDVKLSQVKQSWTRAHLVAVAFFSSPVSSRSHLLHACTCWIHCHCISAVHSSFWRTFELVDKLWRGQREVKSNAWTWTVRCVYRYRVRKNSLGSHTRKTKQEPTNHHIISIETKIRRSWTKKKLL